MRFTPRRPAALAALALGLGACGSSSTGPASDPLAQADTLFVENLVLPSLRYAVSGLAGYDASPYGPLLPFGTVGIAPAEPAALFSGSKDCPTFEPDPFPDADGDGLPDRTTFSFDAAICDTADENGTTDRRGALRLSDPGASPAYDLDFLGFGIVRTTLPGGLEQAARSDGTRRLRGTTSAVGLAEKLDFRYDVTPGTGYRIRTDWRLDFTATEPGSITSGGILPAGTLALEGEVTVESGARRLVLAVQTIEPLVHSPFCGNPVAGSFRAFVPGHEAEGEIRVSYGTCPVGPSVTFVVE